MKARRLYILLVMSCLLVACSTAVPNTPLPTQSTMLSTASASANSNVTYKGPAWTQIPLIDARTGVSFTLASFAGKTVYVEPMATWCTNCRHELPNVEAARLQLPSDQYVFVGLSVAENVDNATLTTYVDNNGWNFTFAVASDAFTKGMVDTFGRTAVTPPSTPHFIIRPDGTFSEMETGSHTPAELVTELKAANGG